MSRLLSSLSKTVHASLALAIILFLGLFYLNDGIAFGTLFAPAALFYFRWAAALTVLSGLILALLNGYLHDAMTLSIGSGVPKHTAIGIGMWLGIIMAFNVWFVIWPNQKRALGIVETDPDAKAKSAKTAMLFSRTNTLLSLPMLLSMVAAQNLF